MAEYIEREALLDSLENAAKKLPNNRYFRGFKQGLGYAASCVVEAPAADVVEVVRCKDCKHYQYGKMFTDIKFCCRLKNNYGEPARYNFADNDFCSYGEKRGKDNE